VPAVSKLESGDERNRRRDAGRARKPSAGTRTPWYISAFSAATLQWMRTMATYDYIKQLLIEKHDVKPDVIRPEATLAELGLDSLSAAELMFDVADKYGIDIPDDRANFTTLGDGAALVDELIQAKGA
jgi:acyl carrier protein